MYYPFYRFYGWITLSFITRPIYYNFIDNAFSRKVILLIFPYIIINTFILGGRYQGNVFFPKQSRYVGFFQEPVDNFIDYTFYDDERKAARERRSMGPSIPVLSIPSRMVD